MKKLKIIASFASFIYILLSNASGAVFSDSLNSGLVGYYGFNGNAGDFSGNGNAGIENNITYLADRFGNSGSAASFGSNSSVEIPGLSVLSYRPTTYNLWLKMAQNPSPGRGFTIIGRKRTWDQQDGALMVTTLQAGFYEGNLGSNNEIIYYTGGYNAESDYSITTNNWFNVSFTYDENQKASFYMNGILIKEISLVVPQVISFPFLIGASSILSGIDNNDSNSWIGEIDDVGVWNTALSSSQISELYALQSSQNTTAVPEPTTFLASLLVCCIGMLYRHRPTRSVK
jgi:hypothetical protein